MKKVFVAVFRIRFFKKGLSVAFGRKLFSATIVEKAQARGFGVRRSDLWHDVFMVYMGRVHGIFFS